MFQKRSSDLVPYAREAIFSSLTDGLVVLDAQGRIVEMNPAAEKILEQTTGEALGKSIDHLLRDARLAEDWIDSPEKTAAVIATLGPKRQAYELRVQPLCDHAKVAAGKIVVLHDITQQQILTEQIEAGNRELQQLTTTDELTRLPNRRQLFEFGERELVRAQRFGHPYALIIFDIDHFKRINEVYGQAVGDSVLVALAPVVQNNLRDTDLVARYGDDEFVITLPETNLAASCEVAERIRKTLAETPITAGGAFHQLTISLGAAEMTAETRRFEDLIGAADNAMSKAKQAGRNRIFFADHSLARHFYLDYVAA